MRLKYAVSIYLKDPVSILVYTWAFGYGWDTGLLLGEGARQRRASGSISHGLDAGAALSLGPTSRAASHAAGPERTPLREVSVG